MIKIAIPTADNVHVFNHFGKTPGFVIVESEDGSDIKKTFVTNDFTGHAKSEHLEEVGQHEHKSHDSIFEALHDIQVVIACGMGRRLYQDFDAKNIEVFITRERSIDAALDHYFKGTLDNDPDKACDH
jgi:predicted Fe-Mo cluster-binding NifX family protein